MAGGGGIHPPEQIGLWDPETGALRGELKGHSVMVSCLAWSRDGGRLASGGWDGTTRLWDSAAGYCC